jgi:hypothetical protein
MDSYMAWRVAGISIQLYQYDGSRDIGNSIVVQDPNEATTSQSSFRETFHRVSMH